MPSLFVSYRRSDSSDTTKLLCERLAAQLPHWRVFYDHRSIEPGDPFIDVLRREVEAADVVLVIIGPRWLEMLRRRGGCSVDYVAEEVGLAMKSGRTVVPVPIGGASLPSIEALAEFPHLCGLAGRHAQPVRPDPDFDNDCQRLTAFLERVHPGVAPGVVLSGKFKLVRFVAEGGMGVIYRAVHLQTKRDVAVKLIKPGMDTKDILARFDAERQALSMMDHPNIASVLDAGATPAGRPFFVMEFVEGVPITEFCDRRKLAIDTRLELFYTVCHAVQHAHNKSVIHRDLKPSNVLVETVADQSVPKVIDFGLAKALGFKLTDKTLLSEAGVAIGTLLYSSPEQSAGRISDTDTRTDVYSLGVILYELLVGEPPFSVEELTRIGRMAMQEAIVNDVPCRPSQKARLTEQSSRVAENRAVSKGRLSSRLRGELDWIVMMALAKEPSRRYQTAAALAKDIERYLRRQPIEAVPPGMAYHVAKFVQRNSAVVIAALLAFLALVAGIVATSIGWSEAVEQRRRADLATAEALAQLRLGRERLSRLQNFNENGLVENVLAHWQEQSELMGSGQLQLNIFAGVNKCLLETRLFLLTEEYFAMLPLGRQEEVMRDCAQWESLVAKRMEAVVSSWSSGSMALMEIANSSANLTLARIGEITLAAQAADPSWRSKTPDAMASWMKAICSEIGGLVFDVDGHGGIPAEEMWYASWLETQLDTLSRILPQRAPEIAHGLRMLGAVLLVEQQWTEAARVLKKAYASTAIEVDVLAAGDAADICARSLEYDEVTPEVIDQHVLAWRSALGERPLQFGGVMEMYASIVRARGSETRANELLLEAEATRRNR